MRLALAAVLAVTSLAHADRPAPDIFQDIATAATCTNPKSPLRGWCIAADFRKGTAAALPTANLVGISVLIDKDADVKKALQGRVTLAALAITRDGKATKLTLSDIAPTTDDQRVASDAALAMTLLLLNGQAQKAYLPAEVGAHVKALVGKYDTTKSAAAWTWKSPRSSASSELRKVGAYWVLVETAPKGSYVTILTDQWAVVP